MSRFLLLLAGAWGWFYWGWSQEQEALAGLGATVQYRSLVGDGLERRLGRLGFVLERAYDFFGNDPKVTDARLVHLKDLKGLVILDVENKQVTDQGLVYLKELRGLRGLDLRGTGVTAQGVQQLQRTLPNTRIQWP